MYFNRKNAEQKNWRMIKKGKHFLFGCSLVFAVGATLATPTVQADTTEAKADTTVGATQPAPNAEGTTYAAPAATSPVATEAVEANSATTVVSADKSQLEAVLAQAKAKNLDGQEASVKTEVTAAIAEAEALVAHGSASQEQVNQSVERLTQAVASVKEVTEATAEKTSKAATESSATPKVRSKRATTEGTTRSVDETRLDRVTVTKDNFDSFFKEGGTANYDETSGTIKLTDDVSGQVGSAYLRFKIDPKEDFTFTGKVDIGNKYEGHTVDNRAGGDGVGFVFHTGNVDKLGQSGASIGMGGIPAAFGFKLDSWHNTSNPNADQKAIADPKNFSGWNNSAFGAFYSSNNAGKVDTIKDAKALNPAPNGDWVDFKINYSGSTKEFTVTYGTQTWTTKIARNSSSMSVNSRNSLSDPNATYALSFLGSTGSGTNLQRVQIEKFEFTAPQIVQVAFYDESGKEIAASSAIPGNRDEVINLNSVEAVQKAISKLDAKGYTLKEVNSEKAETYNAGANTVTLRSGGQFLKYIFKEKEKQSTSLKAPTTKTPVKNTSALTDEEKQAVEAAIKAVNPNAKNVEVATDGAAKVTFKDGSEGNLTAEQTVKAADANGAKAPEAKTPVKDPANLTEEEKTQVAEEILKANPTLADVDVANDGTATVTFPDGSKATLTPAQTVVKAEEKAKDADGLKAPETKTPVKDTANLTDDEKAAVKKAVEAVNPGSVAEVGQDGTTKVTFPDKSEATLTPEQTVVKAAAPVAPSVNPVKAGDKVVTGKTEPGSSVEVTLPDGTKVPGKADKDGNFSIPVAGLKEGDKVSVTATDAEGNKSGATDATVAKAAPVAPSVNPVKAGDTAITGTAEAGSTVEVTLSDGTKVSAKADKDGKFSIPVSGLNAGDTVSVTATDEAGNTSATTTVTVSNVNVGGKDADNAKVPALTPVVDPSNLTDAEKAKVADEVKKANPTATDVKVNNDGSVVVTFADGSVATIAANKVVKEATKESSAQAPAKKAGAKELPNTGTEQSNASLGLALLAAVTGGLLISKKRKEEE